MSKTPQYPVPSSMWTSLFPACTTFHETWTLSLFTMGRSWEGMDQCTGILPLLMSLHNNHHKDQSQNLRKGPKQRLVFSASCSASKTKACLLCQLLCKARTLIITETRMRHQTVPGDWASRCRTEKKKKPLGGKMQGYTADVTAESGPSFFVCLSACAFVHPRSLFHQFHPQVTVTVPSTCT